MSMLPLERDAEQDELRFAYLLEDFVTQYGPRDPRVRHDFRVRLSFLMERRQAIAQAPLIKALNALAMMTPLQLVQPTKEK